MTDEEKAHKYTDEHGFGSDCNNLTSYDANREIEQAYLAGLKAGRPEWHDLQKDPNDLPKVNTKVLLQIKDEDEPIKDFYRRDGVWNFANKYETIAWCEIPPEE